MDIKFILLVIGIFIFTLGYVNQNKYNCNIIPSLDKMQEQDLRNLFNKQNAFVDWDKIEDLDGVKYYRANIAVCPSLKKEFKVRMVPTILIFSGGDAFIKFKAKAGLDLECPVDLPKLVRAIGVVRQEASF